MRLGFEEVVNVGADLGGVVVPGGLPVAVGFPAGADGFAIVVFAPLMDGLVGGAQVLVWAEVGGGGNRAGGERGGKNFAQGGDGGLEFGADFQVVGVVEVESDVAAGPWM